jgi:hypothetical protein
MTVYIDEVTAFKELIDSIKRAAGYAHALGHYQSNPTWFSMRDKFENMIEPLQKLVTAKAMSRTEVLDHLGRRAANAPK